MDSWQKISDIAESVNARRQKASDLVEKSLKRIEETADYNAVIADLSQRARQRATQIDERVASGESAGRLAGVPFVAKDNFLTLGSETTAASNILKGFRAPYQATAIERLEAEGAICVAKTNLDAFAHGSSTENSDFFVTKNPLDPSRVPGGSSGGSAASIALAIAPFALGTDTGGSIRLPASFCGIVGVKPSYGLVSRSGVIAMASSTDVIGPLTANVDDAALVLDVMAGRDELDSTTIERESGSYAELSFNLKNKKIGVIKQYIEADLDPDVRRSVELSIARLKEAGAELQTVSLPSLPLALAVYYIVCPAEISSNLARYDGQRFGFSVKGAGDLEESYSKSRGQSLGAEAKRRIMIGTYVLSSGYYDAYYLKAQTVRTKIINEFKQTFKEFDLLVGPTSPTPAFKIGEKSRDPLQTYLADIMTVAANMSGNPAISIPASGNPKLPVGLQFIAPMGADRQLLAAAKAFEEIR